MTPQPDGRPDLAIGHVTMRVADIARAAKYFRNLGMRGIVEKDGLAVLELRGGTHLVLLPAEEPVAPGTAAPFDLMVDELEATHARWTGDGLAPSEIEHGSIHDRFEITTPDAYTLTIYSSHVSGRRV